MENIVRLLLGKSLPFAIGVYTIESRNSALETRRKDYMLILSRKVKLDNKIQGGEPYKHAYVFSLYNDATTYFKANIKDFNKAIHCEHGRIYHPSYMNEKTV